MASEAKESTKKQPGCRIAEVLQYTCLVKQSRITMPPRTICYPIPRILKLYVILNTMFLRWCGPYFCHQLSWSSCRWDHQVCWIGRKDRRSWNSCRLQVSKLLIWYRFLIILFPSASVPTLLRVAHGGKSLATSLHKKPTTTIDRSLENLQWTMEPTCPDCKLSGLSTYPLPDDNVMLIADPGIANA